MINAKLHKNFKLNGNSFQNEKELLSFSKNVSASLTIFLYNWFDTHKFITVQTSGSTGKPKGIKLKKEHMIHSAIATGSFFDLPENTSALVCLSPEYIAGKMMLVRALVLGWHIDIVEPSSSPLQGVTKDYDFCAMVPLQLENSLSGLYRIKKIIVGGAPVSKKLLKELQGISTAVFATYGMTETSTHIAVKPINNITSSVVERSYFETLPNIKISKDHRNCLVINAPRIVDHKIITNDVVELISETEFKWLGRFDSIINSGGIKLIPELIEKKLATVLDSRFFVFGIPDEKLGQKLVLIVENLQLKIENLKLKIKDLKSLDRYEIPKEIYTVKEFAETETKKVNRKRIIKDLFG